MSKFSNGCFIINLTLFSFPKKIESSTKPSMSTAQQKSENKQLYQCTGHWYMLLLLLSYWPRLYNKEIEKPIAEVFLVWLS